MNLVAGWRRTQGRCAPSSCGAQGCGLGNVRLHTTAIPLYVGAVQVQHTNVVGLLVPSLLPLHPNLERRLPWRSPGLAVNALTSMMTTICIFDIATDDMPQSRVSASLAAFILFLFIALSFPSSKQSSYYKSMDTHLHRSRRQALAPNYASVSGDFV